MKIYNIFSNKYFVIYFYNFIATICTKNNYIIYIRTITYILFFFNTKTYKPFFSIYI